MDMIDIFEAAKKNAPRLEDEYNLCINNNADLDKRCDEDIKVARVSTNKKIHALLYFLRNGVLESGYRYSQRIRSKDFKETLRIIWPTTPLEYIRRRVVFHENVADGPDHIFGMLNNDTEGTAAKDSAYGNYCIVLKNNIFDEGVKSAYCKYDTLEHDSYWTCNNDLECEKCRESNSFASVHCDLKKEDLCNDYADHSHRKHLAVTKLGTSAFFDKQYTTPREGKTEDYIEVCFVHNIQLADIEKVVFHKALVISLFDEAFIKESTTQIGSLPHVSDYRLHEDAEGLLKEKKIYYEPI